MPELSKGQKIASRYTLISRLGGGGMGEVWLANDADLHTRVAVKILIESNDETRRRLLDEYRLLKKLDHPAIVRVFDCAVDHRPALLAMEYLDGGNLTTLKGRNYRQYLPLFIEVSRGLDFLHDAGIVHRDVKLSNICIDAKGHARLTDFGIASVAGQRGLKSGGSPQTASPAQLSGATPTPADDVFSLGAALYEINVGQPPDGPVGPKQLEAVAEPLRPLVGRMLALDPQQRPASMAEISGDLEGVWNADPNATLPPDEMDFGDGDEEDATIVPLDIDRPATVAPAAASHKRSVSGGAAFLLFWYLLAGVVGVFYYLPKFSKPAQVTIPSGGAIGSSAPATAAAPAVEPWKLAQLARAQKNAESILQRLLGLQFDLDEQQVQIWAPDEYQAARQKAIDGDKAFRQRDYDGAAKLYTEGEELLEQLANRSENLVEDNLNLGVAAIEKTDADKAREHFELVLKVEPENSRAADGLKRAETLDQVVSLVEQGRDLEQQGQFGAALEKYRAARNLDARWEPAMLGLNRINRRIAGTRFSDAMSRGFNSMEAQDFAGARAAFNRAAELRPGAPEVAEALAQVDINTRALDIEALRSRAAGAERREDWSSAVGFYRSVLRLDNGLSFARDGERRSIERAQLDQEFEEFTTNPERLSSDSVYQQATETLARAQAITPRGPRLSGQIGELKRLMALSRTTQTVRLTSDNSTEIVVHQVGRLGRFENHQLDLRPGTYTIVGSRAGYQDIRREFRVRPGEEPPLVDVRCEEKI